MKSHIYFFLLGTALNYCLLPLGRAFASTVIDTERKLMTYNNDGDGMTYILAGGVKKSIKYSEENKFPLGPTGKLRFMLDNDRQVKGVLENAGKPGLTSSRPISDMEIIQANETILKMNQSQASSSLAIDPKADPGPVVDSFDALRGKQDCKIVFYEKAVDVCGERFGRQGVVNWTMFSNQLCGPFNCIGSAKFNIGYQSLEGRKATYVEIIHIPTTERFVQVFSSWSGSLPQRI